MANIQLSFDGITVISSTIQPDCNNIEGAVVISSISGVAPFFWAQPGDTVVEITELILFEEKISVAQKNILAIEKNVHEKLKLVDQEKTNLLQRSREYQVMERLKVEQNASWHQYLDKKEAAMLDEVAVMRHGKNPLDGQ